jgi:hypothetical protein
MRFIEYMLNCYYGGYANERRAYFNWGSRILGCVAEVHPASLGSAYMNVGFMRPRGPGYEEKG